MYLLIAIVIMAVATYITRVLPILVFNKKIKSIYIRSFLHYVPYAVLGAMTFPHVFYATGNTTYAAFGTLTAIVLAYFGRSLITVALAAVAVVYVCNLWL